MNATTSMENLHASQSGGLPSTVPMETRNNTAVVPGFNSAQGWELAQRIAKAWMAADLVPQAYKNNLPNTIVALEMANRMGASPLMVMQNLYIVHGNPGWSSKFLIACFNQSGKFSALRYEFKRDASDKATACRAWAIEKVTGEKLAGAWITVEMANAEGWATKSGSKWKTMPEQMLMYRSAAFFVRTYAPEISMGLQTAEEIEDTIYEAPVGSVRTINEMQAPPAAPTAPNPETGEIPAPAPAPEATATQAPKKSYADILDLMIKAKNPEALDVAADWINTVTDEAQRLELSQKYEALRAKLQA